MWGQPYPLFLPGLGYSIIITLLPSVCRLNICKQFIQCKWWRKVYHPTNDLTISHCQLPHMPQPGFKTLFSPFPLWSHVYVQQVTSISVCKITLWNSKHQFAHICSSTSQWAWNVWHLLMDIFGAIFSLFLFLQMPLRTCTNQAQPTTHNTCGAL